MCTEIFGEASHNSMMKAFLIGHHVPVVTLTSARKQECVFVGLDESRNKFNNDLLVYLKSAMKDLVDKVKAANGNWQSIYIRQIDYTLDLSGFFMSVNVTDDLKEFSDKLGIDYSTSLSQLASCFQFVYTTQGDDGTKVMHRRVKVYNKWVHLITSGQKKWMSMNLKKLLEPNIAFSIDKISPTMESGLSRLELSTYFYSYQNQQDLFSSISSFDKQLQQTLNVLNAMPQLNYRLSLSQCMSSFFDMVDKKLTLIAIHDNLQAVAYCYCRRSCTFGGCIVNRTSKAEQQVNFIKRFGRAANRLFIHQEQFLVKKTDQLMQWPINSLNSKHAELSTAYTFDLALFVAYMDHHSIDAIALDCNDIKFQDIFGGVVQDQRQEISHLGGQLIDALNKRQTKYDGKTTLRDRMRGREQEGIDGIDVSGLVQVQKRKANNYWVINSTLYLSCKFFSDASSQTRYTCSHCQKTLIRLGKSSSWRLF